MTIHKLSSIVFAALVLPAMLVAVAPAAADDRGTCFSECSEETDCNHSCSVETAAGRRWITCSTFGLCRSCDWYIVSEEQIGRRVDVDCYGIPGLAYCDVDVYGEYRVVEENECGGTREVCASRKEEEHSCLREGDDECWGGFCSRLGCWGETC